MKTQIKSNVKINFIQMTGAILGEVWIINSLDELEFCDELLVYMN
jgi:hypothetical protein